MSDHILKTIEHARGELLKHEEAIANTKRLINQLCALAGLPAEYQDADLQVPGGTAGALTIRRNAFFGRPLATCVREYLEQRKERMPVKEATLDEVIAALKEGGFDLARVSADEDGIRRGVAITLAKNPQFHRLPNSDWGLVAWYSNIKRAKADAKNGDKPEGEEPAVAEEEATETKPPVKLPAGTPKMFTTEGMPE